MGLPQSDPEIRHINVNVAPIGAIALLIMKPKVILKAFKELFVADHPYDLSLSPFREINAGGVIAERNNVDYFGIEIRNDLLSTPTQIQQMANRLTEIIEKLR